MDLVLFDVRNSIELAISFALFIVKAFAFVDAVSRPAQAYLAVDKQTKMFWVIVLGLFLVAHMLFWRPIGILNLIGTVAAFVYLADARPAMRGLRGGGGRGPYG